MPIILLDMILKRTNVHLYFLHSIIFQRVFLHSLIFQRVFSQEEIFNQPLIFFVNFLKLESFLPTSV